MAKFFMTAKSPNSSGYWSECKSETLADAKNEAATEYGPGYIDDVICIATGDDVTAPREVIASKQNRDGAEWVDHS